MQLKDEWRARAERRSELRRLLTMDLENEVSASAEACSRDSSSDPLRRSWLDSILLAIGVEDGMNELRLLDHTKGFLTDLFFRWTEVSAPGRWDILKDPELVAVRGHAEAKDTRLLAFARLFITDPESLERFAILKMKYEQPPIPMHEFWLVSILRVLRVDGNRDTLEGLAALRSLGRELLAHWRRYYTPHATGDAAS